MMRYCLIPVVVILILEACSNLKEEKRTVVEYPDGQVRKEKVYPNGFTDSLNYTVKQYNPDGSIEMIGHVKDGKEQGVFTWYYPNGNKKWVETFDKGVGVDTVYCYYESGKLKRKVHPAINKTKQAYEFYESGELKIISFIHDGSLIDSLWTGFYKNEKVKESGKVKKGTKIGYWRYYDENGNLLDSTDQTGERKVVFDFEEHEIEYRRTRSEQDE